MKIVSIISNESANYTTNVQYRFSLLIKYQNIYLGSIMLIENFFIVDNFVVGHYKLRFGVPLMVGDVVPLLKEMKCLPLIHIKQGLMLANQTIYKHCSKSNKSRIQ